jgi:hypothetical protein
MTGRTDRYGETGETEATVGVDLNVGQGKQRDYRWARLGG